MKKEKFACLEQIMTHQTVLFLSLSLSLSLSFCYGSDGGSNRANSQVEQHIVLRAKYAAVMATAAALSVLKEKC